MDAYRDQYAQIFNGGQGVTLLAISADADTTLASWARDKDYPFTFLSDVGAKVGQQYGAFVSTPRGALDNRSLFILDREGKSRRVNRVRYYRFADFRRAVASTLKDEPKRKAALAMLDAAQK